MFHRQERCGTDGYLSWIHTEKEKEQKQETTLIMHQNSDK